MALHITITRAWLAALLLVACSADPQAVDSGASGSPFASAGPGEGGASAGGAPRAPGDGTAAEEGSRPRTTPPVEEGPGTEEPTEPGTEEPVDPGAEEPTDPGTEEPTEDPEEPTEDPEDPAEDPEDPVEDPEEPVEDPEEPIEEPEEPTEELSCGEVALSYDAGPDASLVLVAGDFNGWSDDPATGTVLSDEDGDGIFEVVVALDPGTWAYKFVVDGTWLSDPSNPEGVDDGYGGFNSLLIVPECGGLLVVDVTHEPQTATFDALLASGDGSALSPESLVLTVDHQPAPEGSLMAAAGGQVKVELDGLPQGIHDVRVEHSGETLLLKVYSGVSTDWRDAVIYFTMTDRFSNGEPSNDDPLPDVDWRTNYQGGDFRGILDRIEEGYFDDLGVGALWLSWPIDNLDGFEEGARPDQPGCGLDPANVQLSPMRFAAYHGYWPTNLDEVEERSGTKEELQELVDAAHARGIRVLLDFTANHVHEDSPLYAEHANDGYFNQPAEICQDVGWDNKPTTCWFVGYLPDLNYNDPAVREAMLDHAVDWVIESGADGFRLDAVKHVEMSFVEALRQRTGAELEHTGVDFYVVGETFTGDPWLIDSFVGPGRIHGQFDFPSNREIIRAFARGEVGLDEMDASVRSAKAVYSEDAMMSTFLGNHDVARFISHASGDIGCGVWDVTSNVVQGWNDPPGQPWEETPYRKLQLAFTYVYTVPGLPLVYYGDEIGLPGGGDPDNRRMMRFGAELSELEQGTLAFLQTLGQARAAHPALRKGAWTEPLWAEWGLLAYGRVHEDDRAVVLLNLSDETRSGDLGVAPVGLSDGSVLVDALGGAPSQAVQGSSLPFELGPWSAAIYVPETPVESP